MLSKIKVHSSFEIEDFVKTHLCKLRVILRSRVLLCASSKRINVGDSPWNYSVDSTSINGVMLGSLCAETKVKNVLMYTIIITERTASLSRPYVPSNTRNLVFRVTPGPPRQRQPPVVGCTRSKKAHTGVYMAVKTSSLLIASSVVTLYL